MLAYVQRFLEALSLSVVIEAFIVLGLAMFFQKNRRLALIGVLGTLCTIPYVWFVFPTLLWSFGPWIVPVGEGFAVLAEALLYRYFGGLRWPLALLFAIAANGASFLMPLWLGLI